MKDANSSIKNGPSKEEWEKLYSHEYPINMEWIQPLIDVTKEGDRTLELGCGTGSTSKILKEMGRESYTNDLFNADYIFDVTKEWPDLKFDVIFSSGLLEHFNDKDLHKILSESAKRAKTVVSLVPNDGCEGYWEWRRREEETGAWPYGDERPRKSLIKEFREAGIDVVREYMVGNDFGNDNYLLVTVGISTKLC